MIELHTLVHRLILYKMEKGELNFESKESLKQILQEYKIHAKIIEHQLEMCKKDHVELRAEISRLLEENKDLYQKLNSSSENTLFREENMTGNNDALDNLRQQLALALEEKETLEGLWKASLKEVNNLQEKLQHYQSGKQLNIAQRELADAQQNYTEAIKILEYKLSAVKSENDHLTVKTQLLENQLMQVTSQMAVITEKNLSLNTSLKEATSHEQEWKSQYLALEAKYIELDRSYQADKVKFYHIYEHDKVESNLKEKLEGALRQRDELQTALERCHERMADMLRNAANDRTRIEEAVSLVEGAIRARDEALAREAVSAEELMKMKTDLDLLLEEAGLRVAQEGTILKKEFDNQLTTLKEQIHIVEQECNRKTVEVQQLQKECDRLQALLDNNRGADGRDRQLERACDELHFSEGECLQLKMENEALRNSLERLQDKCRRNSREKVKLKREEENAKHQCQLYEHELAVTNEKADLLNTQLHKVSIQLAKLQSESLFKTDRVANPEAKVSVANTIELYRKLDDSYGQMNNKWKSEMNALTEKFEAKLKRIKEKHKNKSKRKLSDEMRNDIS